MGIDSIDLAVATNSSIGCQPEVSSGVGSASVVLPRIFHNESETAVVALAGEVRR